MIKSQTYQKCKHIYMIKKQTHKKCNLIHKIKKQTHKSRGTSNRIEIENILKVTLEIKPDTQEKKIKDCRVHILLDDLLASGYGTTRGALTRGVFTQGLPKEEGGPELCIT